MRHRFHSLCPYFAMFPESFVESWIDRLTAAGDLVLDPFCGRGTTPFQALLMDRRAIAADINAVAYCVSRAKTNAPDRSRVAARITRLEREFDPKEWSAPSAALPPFFRHAFHANTLTELLYLRERLEWRRSDVDCMVAALMLGALHGEADRSTSYLSNQMPRTISTKPDYSIRFWKERNLRPPKRDTFAILRQHLAFRYASPPPKRRAVIFHTDMRELPRLLDKRLAIRCAITSPPYLDVTSFEEDQWLRLWFLGGAPHPTHRQISYDDRHRSDDPYWAMIGDMWRTLGSVLDEKADVVIRIGMRNKEPDGVVDALEGTSVFSRRAVRLLSYETSEIPRRQTDAFRPGSTGCIREMDCHFRIR